MKKRGRRARLPDASCQTTPAQTVVTVVKKPGRRGRPKNALRVAQSSVSSDGDVDKGDGSALQSNAWLAAKTETNEQPVNRPRPTGTGRVSTAFCRLCHGKFSPRRLRHAFDRWPGRSLQEPDSQTELSGQSPLLFHSDFQRLVGVPLVRDPQLPQFVCKNCHTKFYKCHRILLAFLQRVNHQPGVGERARDRKNQHCSQSASVDNSLTAPSMPSDPQRLHGLVSWAHRHGEACRSCPSLKEVLEGQCWGSVKAVWGCVDGHSFVMDTQTPQPRASPGHTVTRGSDCGGGSLLDGDGHWRGDGAPEAIASTLTQPSPAATPQTQRSMQVDTTTTRTDDFLASEETPPPVTPPLEDRTGDSDFSDRDGSSEEFEGDRRKDEDVELFQPYPEKRVAAPRKKRSAAKPSLEPKEKKKPGPKPGWKKKFKLEREELPNIYKCPYQGCTAVYRGADGMKKHIKEHHEEVRERPCPHPGCNKVFMIDRYLQRHVKLIHTEVRNYICDQCGQTFKQRKHLSVHQMRHSGAKPLQCEVCGFQCRQRASLKYHMTKHKAEADLDFECAMCGKRFEKAHNLNVHMSMVHPLTQGGSSTSSLPQDPLVQTISATGELVAQLNNSLHPPPQSLEHKWQ
ncbi:zinc finger protein 276 [Hypomesus transpacificus]|uniref:zinc finger protein 276 n=1 Tax=Hypomesus transpacificus TaxID=137520 RepID=UPI001F084F51|nr:zinc finger protein 276 [Hypomesus transpacificus]